MSESYFAGIDAGSTYLKVALIQGDKIIDVAISNSGIGNSERASKMLDEIAKNNNISRDDIKYIIATGYSRRIIDVADDDVSEITAHAYGIRMTAPAEFKPGVIIDIGGQDSKVIYLDSNYAVTNFLMNDKCAAGTGKFMETCAQILETSIEEIGPLSLESNEPCDINSTCVVFAQSEIISLIARDHKKNDILYGMHLSMAKRVIKMIRSNAVCGDFILTGGGGLNIGLKKAFEDELLADIYVSNYPQFNGAIGAAYLAQELHQK